MSCLTVGPFWLPRSWIPRSWDNSFWDSSFLGVLLLRITPLWDWFELYGFQISNFSRRLTAGNRVHVILGHYCPGPWTKNGGRFSRWSRTKRTEFGGDEERRQMMFSPGQPWDPALLLSSPQTGYPKPTALRRTETQE